MCGLVYFKSFNHENILPDLLKRYQAQRTRGQQGFGVFYPGSGLVSRATTEKAILENIADASDKEYVEALFHHRMPTSTENVMNACHPFTTGRMFKHNYVLAHNGIIWNDDELHKAHQERGIQYHSIQPDGKFNDSEALLWEIAMYLEGATEAPATKGGAAFIVIEQALTPTGARPVKLHFSRNQSNPLFLTLTDERIVLASEKGQWDDDAHAIMPDFLYTLDYRTKKLSLKPLKLETYRPAKPAYGGKGNFVQGRGWLPNTSVEDDDIYDYSGRSVPVKRIAAPKTITTTAEPAIRLLTGDELDHAADNMLSRLLDNEPDADGVETRLHADLKRARQAVDQLGRIVRNGGARPRIVKKYYKYLQFQNTCLRAVAMLSLIVDPMEEVADVYET